jgi:DNA-directed RNA polymerase subunit RPC12/RpoP
MVDQRPVQPVAPSGMELIFMYRCPHCGRKAALIAPMQPAMVQCDACQTPFPVVPVDERTVKYIKLMLAEGRAAVDPDFV